MNVGLKYEMIMKGMVKAYGELSFSEFAKMYRADAKAVGVVYDNTFPSYDCEIDLGKIKEELSYVKKYKSTYVRVDYIGIRRRGTWMGRSMKDLVDKVCEDYYVILYEIHYKYENGNAFLSVRREVLV